MGGRRRIWTAALVCLLVAGAAVAVRNLSVLRTAASAVAKAAQPQTPEVFPDIATDHLSVTQRRIVDVLRQESTAPRPGTFYAQGADEPWCSDFTSWVMRSAGVPFKNPNSGSWRIPGTLTLREYYKATHRFHPASSGYRPVVGDAVLYDDPSPFGQHVNIVISSDGGRLVTVGGNEIGGVRVHTHTAADDAVGLIGYGSLPPDMP